MKTLMAALLMGLAPLAQAEEPKATPEERVKVDNGNGTWSYQDRGLRVGTVEWEGNILWQYERMQEYNDVPIAWPKKVPYEHFPESKTREERLMGSVKIDGYGQRWVAIDVDLSESEDLFSDFSDPLDEDMYEFGEWSPQGWNVEDCSGDGVVMYDTESRTPFTYISVNRHYRVVMIVFDTSPVYGCTGVQVSPTTVLTNAHCTTDYGTEPVGVTMICSRGNTYFNADCMSSPPGGFTTILNSAWENGDDSHNLDYSLIQWSAGGGTDASSLTGAAVSGIPLSGLSETEIEATTITEYGHGHYTYPGSCQYEKDTTPIDTMYTHGWHLLGETRSDHWIQNGLLKTRMDCSPGQSGAPYFTTDTEELVGLHSGAYWPWPSSRYCGGPDVSQFRDFVNENL